MPNAVYYSNREGIEQVKSITNFAAANRYFNRFNDQANTEYSLNNMRQLMTFLGNPQDKFRAVHVAGTSGKTSTAYFMAALLVAAGRKTGLTVSPHVDEVNERVQLNGQPLGETEFCSALTSFAETIESAPVRPSSFELKVAFAYWYFAREEVEYVVMEVGLGGLKDATNVMSRRDKVCIITDIGYDHINVLGGSLPEIAAQKAGIIQPGNAVFSYRQPEDVMKVLRTHTAERQATLQIIESAANDDETIPDYQYRNWSLSRRVYDFLVGRDDLPPLSEAVLRQTRHITIPGRMDVRRINGKTIVMDGAHNGQKIEAFVDSFRKLYPGAKPAILLGMRDGKDYETAVPLIASLASRVITTAFVSSQDLPVRSLPPQKLAAAFKNKLSVKVIADQSAAFQELVNGPEKICVVTGSLYLLGQIRNNEQLA
jgi:dihydrofolate synthase/folylpolyglutamate synthase